MTREAQEIADSLISKAYERMKIEIPNIKLKKTLPSNVYEKLVLEIAKIGNHS